MNKNLLYLLVILALAAAGIYFVARMYRLPSAQDSMVMAPAPAQAPAAVQVAPSSPTAPIPASQAPAEVDVAIVEDTTETP